MCLFHTNITFASFVSGPVGHPIDACPLRSTSQVVLALGDYLGVTVHACIGGTNVQEDVRMLEHGVHVVVATPGRALDVITRRALDTRSIKMFVARRSR